MIIGGLLTVAPVFGPLGKTLHYLADFIAERPQPMRVPDISFFAELLALIVCPVAAHVCHIAGFIYPKWQPKRATRMIATSASNQAMQRTTGSCRLALSMTSIVNLLAFAMSPVVADLVSR